LELIRENPKITAKEMAEKTEISLRTIRRILDNLANKNIIERQGPDKNGIWLINKNDLAL
jgi:predicted HTH transcriptional regulator